MKLATIDIGSNSVHMAIVRGYEDGTFEGIDREKDVIKLGAGTFVTGRLSPEAFSVGVDTLVKFVTLARSHGVDEVIAVATSAVREAENGGEFIEAVHRATGIRPRVVSGEEEARLIHLAVCDFIDLTDRSALVLDIGGGSLELIVGNDREMLIGRSLPLGVRRLRDLAGAEDPLSRSTRRKIETYLRDVTCSLMDQAAQTGYSMAIGTSGTIMNLGIAACLHHRAELWASPHGQTIRLKDVRELVEELLVLNAVGRADVPGVDSHRADTVHLGGLLLVTLLDLADVDSIVLCDSALREGLIIDRLRRQAMASEERDARRPDIRRRSIDELARRCGERGPHGERVAELALRIFDETAALHRRGPDARRILESAALLHDVGRHVAFERHEHHAYYLIRHGGLSGLSDHEIELIALVARYHRKATPKPRHPAFAALRPRERRLVRALAGMLRIADGLDRTRRQVVERIHCEIGADKVRIVVRACGDADVELWAARRKAGLLAKALERVVEVELEAECAESDSTA